MARKTIAYVVYPGISLLELVGTFSAVGLTGRQYESIVVGEKAEGESRPVNTFTDTPMAIIPQKTFDEVPHPDILVVIGGQADTLPALENLHLLEYIQRAGAHAQVIAATSTGSLLLAKAGLLKGRRATTHWFYADQLTALGAVYEQKPWVEDGKFITAAGVSGGIDMGLALGANLVSKSAARSAQLMLEYDPHPPFGNVDWAWVHEQRLVPMTGQPTSSSSATKDIAFVMYPDMTTFDLVGPLQVISALSRIDPRIRPFVIVEHNHPLPADIGIQLISNCTFDELPTPAGFVIPGGTLGTERAMSNPAVRRYIRNAARDAEWIVSVCTVALILASVELLEGCEVTIHWLYQNFLPAFGGRYVQKRWTHNGKIINAAGVSAGIDMALYLTAQMTNPEIAREIQAMIQYDPQPPFGGIDYAPMGFLPRLLIGGNNLRSPFVTAKPPQMIEQGI